MHFPFQSGIHLKQNEIYVSKIRCPICLSKEKRKFLLQIQKNPNVNLLLCGKCQGASVSHMPKPATLNRCYSTYYQKNDHDNEPKVTFNNPTRFARHILKYMHFNKENRGISILDFGGGDGSLSKAVAHRLQEKNKSARFKIVVVDYLSSNNFYSDNIKINFVKNLNGIHFPFDIIIASGVIEHVPEVNFVLKKLFNLMAKNGYFYARTPLVAPFKKYMNSIDFTYPFHVHDMGSSFWNRIIETFKLKSTKIITSKPAIAETEFNKEFLFTTLSYIFKAPAFVELFFSKKKIDLLWNFYSSWEIILCRE